MIDNFNEIRAAEESRAFFEEKLCYIKPVTSTSV